MSEKNMLSGVLAKVAGPLKDFVKKFNKKERNQWLTVFKRFLGRKKVCPEFLIWKTIKLGTGLKTTNDFQRALHDGGFKVSDRASDILRKTVFTVINEEIELNLIKVTVRELGFKKGAQCNQIYERAKEFGLELCPPEVGPQLRLQYQDQPDREWILIAMEPIVDSDNRPELFDVVRLVSVLWLRTSWGVPNHFWCADREWVFCRPCRPRK